MNLIDGEDLEDDDDEYSESRYSHPLTAEEIADPKKVLSRLSLVYDETAQRLMEEAGIVLSPHWPDGVVRSWDWHALVWKVTPYRGPWKHPSWDGSTVIFFTGTYGEPGFEAGEWVDDPTVLLPPGYEFFDHAWHRHR